MATAKKATTRKTAAKKAPAKKATARKAAPKKAQASMRHSAEKIVNIYLGVIGKSIDTIQVNVESARKDNEKRMKDLELRGVKLRKELTKRLDKIEASDVVEDAREQFNKVQDQLEDAVDSVKDKLNAAKAA
jgi:methyl-accepting chemotaxis protein